MEHDGPQLRDDDPPELDAHGIPTDADIHQATDEEWLAAMASVPADPGSDADLATPDDPGGPDDDAFPDTDVDAHLDPGQDDPALDTDVDDEHADLVDTDTDDEDD